METRIGSWMRPNQSDVKKNKNPRIKIKPDKGPNRLELIKYAVRTDITAPYKTLRKTSVK